MAVNCAGWLQDLAAVRTRLLGDASSPTDQKRTRRAIAAAEAAMRAEGLGWVGFFAHNVLVSILNAMDRRDFGFLRTVADVLEGDGLSADPIREALISIGMCICRPGQNVFEAIAEVRTEDVIRALEARKHTVTEAAVRRARRDLSGAKGRPGRPRKSGQ